VFTLGEKIGIFSFAMSEIGLDIEVSQVQSGALSLASDSLVKQCFGGRVGTSSSYRGCFDNLGDGSIWVLNDIMEFCEKMGLEVRGKDNEVFDFLIALEVARKKTALRADEEEEVVEGGKSGKRTVLNGGEH